MAQRQISELIAAGDYLDALGTPPEASRLQIETASARLSQAHPALAGVLGGITRVLTAAELEEIYRITAGFRDRVMATLSRRYGDELWRQIPHCRALVWAQCQGLLRCELEKGDVKIGPAGAESIARRGSEWVIEAVLNASLPVISPGAEERRRGHVTVRFQDTHCGACRNSRYLSCEDCGGTGKVASEDEPGGPIILADDFEMPAEERADCDRCRGRGRLPCDCRDDYVFRVPAAARVGTVLEGRGRRTGRRLWVHLDGKVVAERPNLALAAVYLSAMAAARFPGAGVALTLEEAEEVVAQGSTSILIFGVCTGSVVGWLLGSWPVGLLVTLPAAVGSHYLPRFLFNRRRQLLILAAMVLAILSLGPLLGYFLASWQVGLRISGAVVAGGLILSLLSRYVHRKIQ